MCYLVYYPPDIFRGLARRVARRAGLLFLASPVGPPVGFVIRPPSGDPSGGPNKGPSVPRSSIFIKKNSVTAAMKSCKAVFNK